MISNNSNHNKIENVLDSMDSRLGSVQGSRFGLIYLADSILVVIVPTWLVCTPLAPVLAFEAELQLELFLNTFYVQTSQQGV